MTNRDAIARLLDELETWAPVRDHFRHNHRQALDALRAMATPDRSDELRAFNVAAARIVAAHTKHGPNGSGGPGPCDQSCIKCSAEAVLGSSSRFTRINDMPPAQGAPNATQIVSWVCTSCGEVVDGGIGCRLPSGHVCKPKAVDYERGPVPPDHVIVALCRVCKGRTMFCTPDSESRLAWVRSCTAAGDLIDYVDSSKLGAYPACQCVPRCDECDPSFSCWTAPGRCSKRPR